MVILRKFEASDSALVSSKLNLFLEKAKSIIDTWNSGCHNGVYFEMFAIQSENTLVGMISLYEHSGSILSIGPEIFEEYQRHGFAKAAMTEAMRIAEEKKYRIIFQQIRTNNAASIRLHESLGFERDSNIFKNKKGNDVYIYLKVL